LKSADEIARLNSSFAFRVLRDVNAKHAGLLQMLPSLLTLCAEWWAGTAPDLARVRPDSQEKLLQHMLQATGRPHYEELAALIGAARGQDYDAVALRNWAKSRGLTKHRERQPAKKK
jgi:hypothetical protein